MTYHFLTASHIQDVVGGVMQLTDRQRASKELLVEAVLNEAPSHVITTLCQIARYLNPAAGVVSDGGDAPTTSVSRSSAHVTNETARRAFTSTTSLPTTQKIIWLTVMQIKWVIEGFITLSAMEKRSKSMLVAAVVARAPSFVIEKLLTLADESRGSHGQPGMSSPLAESLSEYSIEELAEIVSAELGYEMTSEVTKEVFIAVILERCSPRRVAQLLQDALE
ncbi:hypothetical protein EW146_g7452 [Bondarzewia mesenterica]|uniref:Uncharacterized protein n=1 Tax=Bondarzewia mesenterica TaxID=1095465 RepID=A0A4S4LMM3_9AGAM|nr:hypothetical protein EW146_g7452 [Bondarzewia mesenterica]